MTLSIHMMHYSALQKTVIYVVLSNEVTRLDELVARTSGITRNKCLATNI